MTTSMTAIYGGGPLYDPTEAVVNDIIDSKYSTYVYWTLHVTSTGDITHNGSPLVTNGTYVGSTSWVTQLVKLKEAGVRILFSIGSWPYPDTTTPWIFYQINANMPTKSVTFEGNTFEVYTVPTSDTNILYKNFKELRSAFKYIDSQNNTHYAIDGLNFDNEDYYSSSLMATFARMLYEIGYSQVTFCPFTQSGIWNDTLSYIASGNNHPVEGKAPISASGSTLPGWTTKGMDTYATALDGFVTEYQLQCYDGGSGNFPAQWISEISNLGLSSAVPVYPGYEVNYEQGATPSCNAGSIVCPAAFETAFNNMAKGYSSGGSNPNPGTTPNSVDLTGGFVWYYDQIQHCENAPNNTTGCSETPNASNYCASMCKGLGITAS